MPESQNTRADRLRKLLTERFAPQVLEVIDDSARHAGHAGARPEGETHFHVRMVAAAFAGQSRVQRQRAVHAAVAEEFAKGMHALSLDLRTPEEAAERETIPKGR
jgi:stress-induced morphogen